MADFHRSLDAALQATRPVEAPEMCAHITYQQTLHSPTEWCEGEAVDGSEYCEAHQPYDPEDDPFVGWDPSDISYWGD